MWWLVDARVRRRTDPGRLLARVDAEIQGLVAELNETADRNVTVLEDRVAALQELLAQADRTVSDLRDAHARQPAQVSEAFKLDLERRRVDEVAPRSTRDEVVRLHQSGLSSDIIAGRLNLAVGEVELILSIHSGRDRGRTY